MRSSLLVFLFFVFTLNYSCVKTEYIYNEAAIPTINIESSRVISMDSCLISINIDNKGKLDLVKGKVVLEDITIYESPSIIQFFELSSEITQSYDFGINVNKIHHDFKVTVFIETEKNTFESEDLILRFPKFSATLDYCRDCLHFYRDLSNGVVESVSRGEHFVLRINYTGGDYTPYFLDIKLNGTIPVKHNLLLFDGYAFDGESDYEKACDIYITDNIEAGDYNIHLFVDGMEYISDFRIRVLKKKSFIYDDSCPDHIRRNMAWFVIDDCIYYVGGDTYNTPSSDIGIYPVWVFNIKNKTWEKKNNFPNKEDYCNIFPFNLQWNDKVYILLDYQTKIGTSSIQLWEYNHYSDSWEIKTTYPGNGTSGFITFIIDGNLYIGGGTTSAPGTDDGFVVENDFWSYDLNNDEWEQKKNISPYYRHSSCSSLDKGYVFTNSKELWEYNPGTDSWSPKKRLEGGPYFRDESSILYWKNSIYISGGIYQKIALNDVWQYSILSDSWELVCLLPKSFFGAPIFTYNNNLYAGYLVDRYYGLDYTKYILKITE